MNRSAPEYRYRGQLCVIRSERPESMHAVVLRMAISPWKPPTRRQEVEISFVDEQGRLVRTHTIPSETFRAEARLTGRQLGWDRMRYTP